MGRKLRNDYRLRPLTALTPLRIARKCHWYVSPRILFFLTVSKRSFWTRREESQDSCDCSAYVCRPCMRGFVPEQKRESRLLFSTYEMTVQRFRETRALCRGWFLSPQKQGLSGLGSGSQTEGVHRESTIFLLHSCCSCLGSGDRTDHGDISFASMGPDSQAGPDTVVLLRSYGRAVGSHLQFILSPS